MQFAYVLHILGFIAWLGGLFAVTRILILATGEADAGFRLRLGGLARKLALTCDIGATLTLLGGLWLLVEMRDYVLAQPWMHIKLTLVLVLLGVHGLVRVKAKKASLGPAAFPGALLPVLSLLAIAIVILVIFKPLSR